MYAVFQKLSVVYDTHFKRFDLEFLIQRSLEIEFFFSFVQFKNEIFRTVGSRTEFGVVFFVVCYCCLFSIPLHSIALHM